MSILRSRGEARLRIVDAESGDELFLPVVSYTTSYALSELPTASVQLGLGSSVYRDSVSPVIDAKARQMIRERQKCQLLVSLRGDFRHDTKWPEGGFVLFEGKIDSVGDAITATQASLSVTLKHWLSDLQSAPILAGYANTRHPLNKNFYASAYSILDSGVGGAIKQPAGIGMLADANILTSTNLSSDLWALGIKQLFASILTNYDAAAFPVATNCDELINAPEQSAFRALQRIEGESQLLGSPYSSDAQPTLMQLQAGDIPVSSLVTGAIADVITNEPLEMYQQQDMWSRLVLGLAPELDFVIVPRATSAIVAPNMPALRDAYCRHIAGRDIVQIDVYEPIRKPWRAVGIWGRAISETGTREALGHQGMPGFATVSCYAPGLEWSEGAARYFLPPRWLQRIGVAGADPTRTTGMPNKTAVGGVANPGMPSGQNSGAQQPPRQSVDEIQGYYDSYAQLRYAQERLRGKAAKVVGKLRFDLAPGTSVRVFADTSQVRGLGGDNPQLQGRIGRVTILHDCVRKAGITLFDVQHIRTLKENESDMFTLERHPLYPNSFLGTSLIPEYGLPECP